MIEKINDILFHPSRLNQFHSTNIFKVLLFLLILTIFSLCVQIIDIIKSPGLTIADRDVVEINTGFDFDNAYNLPNCSIVNNQYTCKEDSMDKKEIGTFFGVVKLISDINEETKTTDLNYYILLTKDSVKIKNQFRTLYNYKYDELPKEWRNFDFEGIKDSNLPSENFYILFISGFNQIIKRFIPGIIIFYIIFSFIINLLQTLFFSLLFYLLYRRFSFRFGQLFRISVYAQALPITILVILSLLNINIFNAFIFTFLTFLYVYIAINHSVPQNKEF